jgi:D-proline reductase (dithiol) PrdB
MCNQTVGLVQREIETQGISTVGVSIVREISEKVNTTRTYFLKYPFGHALGEPFNKKQQVTIFKECLNVLESAQKPGVIVDSPYRWRRHQFN